MLQRTPLLACAAIFWGTMVDVARAADAPNFLPADPGLDALYSNFALAAATFRIVGPRSTNVTTAAEKGSGELQVDMKLW